MATQASARISGDDYQHLFAWLHVLELLMPRSTVSAVIVEDEEAVSADDVTVLRELDADAPDRYHQVKYHVDQRSAYSVDKLLERTGNGRSLLQKWFRSWDALTTARPPRQLELHIISNWAWATGDPLAQIVRGEDNALKDDLLEASPATKLGKLRDRITTHLGASPQQFTDFTRTLRFRLGNDSWREMADRTAERMEHLGLKSDNTALLVAVGIVRGWVKEGRQELDGEFLKSVIEEHDLRLQGEVAVGVHVHITTIKEHRFEITPDYSIDWREHFGKGPGPRGHEPLDPAAWNDRMLPELRALEERISSETEHRLIRARGLARLSAWFCFGFVFSEVARYTIEVDQQEQLWRTDAEPSANFLVSSNGPEGDIIGSDGDTVVVGISVTGNLEDDVRRDLQRHAGGVRAALFIRPERDLGRYCLRGPGDAVALANEVKQLSREFVKAHGARRLLLYYLGPLSAACFIGHQLNAVCREIQVMEWSDPNYTPSFSLT